VLCELNGVKFSLFTASQRGDFFYLHYREGLLTFFFSFGKEKSKQKRKENPPQRLIVLTRCKAPLRLFCYLGFFA